MKVLHLHPGPDTAGQSMAGKAVLEAGGDEVRVFAHSPHEFGYAPAPRWNLEAVRESWRWADVVVVHNDPAIIDRVADAGPRPPELIVHHHGSRFRNAPDRGYMAAAAIGARQVVSTVDLLCYAPAGAPIEWLPQVIDVERMASFRAIHAPAPGSRLRVSHAPTNRMIKGTRHVIRSMRTLHRMADFVLIQHQPWTICLALKATSDVFVDQLSLGYGNNAIEAWAMGLPVIAAAPEPILERMRLEFGGDLPFLATTITRLTGDIRSLVASEDLRAEWAARGMAHVERFHAPTAWAERIRRIYAGDLSQAKSKGTRGKAA